MSLSGKQLSSEQKVKTKQDKALLRVVSCRKTL